MKKYILIAAMALTLAAPAAWSQNALPPGGNGNGPAPQGQGGQNEDPQHFQQHKAEILQRMNEHLADVQKRISCVQAATDQQALRACMPQRGGEGHGWQHHGGERGPGPAGQGDADGAAPPPN